MWALEIRLNPSVQAYVAASPLPTQPCPAPHILVCSSDLSGAVKRLHNHTEAWNSGWTELNFAVNEKNFSALYLLAGNHSVDVRTESQHTGSFECLSDAIFWTHLLRNNEAEMIPSRFVKIYELHKPLINSFPCWQIGQKSWLYINCSNGLGCWMSLGTSGSTHRADECKRLPTIS